MTRMVSMEFAEYEQDMQANNRNGFLAGLGHMLQFAQSKKKPSEFYGLNQLDPQQPNHHMMIAILTELGYGEDLQLAIKKAEAPEAPQPTESLEEVSQPIEESKPTCCGSESACPNAAPSDQPLNQ